MHRWVNRALRWLLGLIFLLATIGLPGTRLGAGKLTHPYSFAKNIRTYKMVPQPLVFPMAVYVPWLELTTGLALLVGVWRRESIWLALFICSTFLIANVAALARGLDVDCGCFGPGYHGTAATETLLVLAMLAVGVGALRTLSSGKTDQV
jgi:hypothetical protein